MKDGYKKTELGEIPIDWEVKRLEEFSISSSYGPRFSAELYDESGNCRIIRGTDVIANGKVDYAVIPYASISNEVLEKHRLIENDFVVVTTADCGVSFVFDTSGVFMPSAYMVRIRFNDKISPYFVNKFFYTKIIKRQVEKHIRKGTLANLPGSDLLKFKICIPPLLEQKKIAKIISTVDSQIDNTDKLIDKTEELKMGLMQRLLTKGIGHTEFKKTEVGEIPGEWEIRKLGEIGEVVMGQSPFGDSYNNEEIGTPLLNGPTEFTEKYPIPKQWTTKPTKICKENDVLFCVRGSSVGRMNISDNKYCIGRGLAAIREKNGETYTTYLYYILQKFINNILNLSVGSTFPNVGKDDLNGLSCTVPPLEEQRKIANILSSVDSDIEEYKNKKIKLEELKKALMQQLLTGKIRVI